MLYQAHHANGRNVVFGNLCRNLFVPRSNLNELPEFLDLRDGSWEALGYSSLGNLKGKARSMAYYLGRGEWANATITVRTSYAQPYVIVLRFKGSLPW